MEITEVKVYPVKEEKLKAFVSIVLDGCFMINDIKIIQGRENRFISMPSRRKKSGDFKDVAHPLNSETRRKMEDRILSEYDRVRGVRKSAEPKQPVAAAGADSGASRPELSQSEVSRSEVSQSEVSQAEVSQAEASQSEAEPVVEESARSNEEHTLKEVADKHLSDSFWTT